jgi:hypothetical protein
MRTTSNIHASLRAVMPLLALAFVMAFLGGSARAASTAVQASASRAHSCPDFEVPNGPAVFSVRTTGVTCTGAHRIVVSFMTDTRCVDSRRCVVHGFSCRETYGGGTETSGSSDYFVSCKAGARRVHFLHGV